MTTFLTVIFNDGAEGRLIFNNFKDAYKYAFCVIRADGIQLIDRIRLTNNCDRMTLRRRKYAGGDCIILRNVNTLKASMWIREEVQI